MFQEEFHLILEQFDVQNKLNTLEKLMEQQPEGSFGVPLSDVRPATAMRALNCKKKQEECERLQAWLKQLERCAPSQLVVGCHNATTRSKHVSFDPHDSKACRPQYPKDSAGASA